MVGEGRRTKGGMCLLFCVCKYMGSLVCLSVSIYMSVRMCSLMHVSFNVCLLVYVSISMCIVVYVSVNVCLP